MTAFEKRCEDCACLVMKNGKMCCDECFGQLCSEIDDCPEGLSIEEVEKAQTLTAEQKKAVKKATITTSEEKVEKKAKRERKPVENPEKEALIDLISKALNLASMENVIITNKTREITFKKGENEYKLTLTATRKPKK